jgi:hypothetical protein
MDKVAIRAADLLEDAPSGFAHASGTPLGDIPSPWFCWPDPDRNLLAGGNATVVNINFVDIGGSLSAQAHQTDHPRSP